MKIPFNEFLANVKTSGTSASGYYFNGSGVEDKTIANIMLCILYHNKKISRASFLARMNGDNTRRVNTYKSKVLNEWFNDAYIVDVLIKEAETCAERDLTFNQYFELLNLGLNRNRSYCVDVIAIGIFKAMLDQDPYSYRFYDFVNESKVAEINFISFEYADRNYDLACGYCCEDHDGSWYEYKRQRYEHEYRVDKREIVKQLRSAFLTLKPHLRNPLDKVINWD